MRVAALQEQVVALQDAIVETQKVKAELESELGK
jgi:hypothetical protein